MSNIDELEKFFRDCNAEIQPILSMEQVGFFNETSFYIAENDQITHLIINQQLDQEKLFSLSCLKSVILLHLSGVNNLSQNIVLLKNLKHLHIIWSQLEFIPDWVGSLSNLISLDISGNGFSILPDWMGSLTNLTSLNLGYNGLGILPDCISSLSNLTSLNIEYNGTETLPDWISSLSNLSNLNISGNELGILPDTLSSLTNLTNLNISGNELGVLPDWIGSLSNLTSLDISGNELGVLPDWLNSFTNLINLDIGYNGIAILPDWISSFTNITSLNISGNDLEILPDWIDSLSNLTFLDISHNKLLTLSDNLSSLTNLTSLNISANYFEILPNWIGSLTNLTNLDISNNKLSTLSDNLNSLTNLTSLNISANNFEILPDWIGSLTNLTNLDISNNKLSTLSDNLNSLTKLTNLDISNNKLSTLSDNLNSLTNLTRLDISANDLGTLPDWIGSLTNLTNLFVSRNGLETLPDSLSSLRNLSRLFVSENALKNLPNSLSSFSKLTNLDISNNMFSTLPDWIDTLTNLTYLNISGNELGTLPNSLSSLTNLTDLNISKNSLTTFPDWIGSLNQLRSLVINHNNINTLPEFLKHLPLVRFDITLKNLNIYFYQNINNYNKIRLLDYIFETQSIGKELNEAKLLVVGDERVGKTSVVNALTNKPHNRNHDTTEGINIESHPLNNGIKLNIWDFAGQEITHQTHQFFLSTRSLYLLVIDAQQEDNESHIDHWLKTIKTNASDSPIIVVVNKIEKNRSYIFDFHRYKSDYNIIDVIYLSAERREHIDKLIESIQKHVSVLDGVKKLVQPQWLQIKAQIEEEKQKKDYLEINEYEKICNTFGISEEKEQHFILNVLNQIGTIVSYKAKNLSINQILNPIWVTNGVYKIIRSPQVSENNAFLDENHFKEIFQGNERYKERHFSWLMALLEQFELAFRVEKQYLIPSALKTNQPEFDLESYKKLNFRLEYEYLKKNLISHFIVKSHTLFDHTLSFPPYWKNGVFIAYKDSKAVVISMPDKNVIDIHINTSNKSGRELLAIIRNYFQIIHNENIKVSELVHLTLPEHINQFEEYEMLCELENEKIETNRFGRPPKVYNIFELLNGYRVINTIDFHSKLTRDLVHISELLLDSRQAIMNEKEDLINDRYSNMLRAKSYNISDQSRGGQSQSGKSVGERDIVIRENNTDVIKTIIEALVIKSFEEKNIRMHITKAVSNYNTQGSDRVYLLVYSKIEDFNSIWTKYKRIDHSFEDITHQFITHKNNIKLCKTLHDQTELIHIVINFFVNAS